MRNAYSARRVVTPLANSSLISRGLLVIAVVAVFAQAISLYRRGSREESDISVFYRATKLLQNGVGGELYTMRDSATGWPIPIPPAGLSLFQPLSSLSPSASTALWAVINLLILGAGVVVLYKYFAALEKERQVHLRIYPYVAAIFLIMSSACLQVGQYSIIFTACWIFALYACIQKRTTLMGVLTGVLFALPAAIKVYPAVILAAPLVVAKTRRSKLKVLSFFALGFVLSCTVLPGLMYQSRTPELTASWWRNVIFSSKSRMSEMRNLGSGNNQSLDSLMLRYLTYDVEFHNKKRNLRIPNLDLPPEKVLTAANVIRLAFLCITIAATLSWRRRNLDSTPYNLLIMAALWSATLYLMLPETRGRYAVYTTLAFVPLLVWAHTAGLRGDRAKFAWRSTFIVVCFALTLLLIPKSLRAFGLGFLGPLLLWITNLRLLGRQQSAELTNASLDSTTTADALTL